MSIAILVTVGLVVARPASAAELTAEGQAHVGDVRDLLYAGSTTSTRPPPSDPVLAQSLRDAELEFVVAPPPGPTRDLVTEMDQLRRASKVKWGLRILGRVGLSSAAGWVGWEVGSVIADEIYSDDVPAVAPASGWDPSYQEMMAVQAGECLAFADYPGSWGPPDRSTLADWQARNAYCATGGGMPGSRDDPATLRAPADGWVLLLREDPFYGSDYYSVQFAPGPEGHVRERLDSEWPVDNALYATSGCRQVTHPLADHVPAGFMALRASVAEVPHYEPESQTYTCNRYAVVPEVISDQAVVWFKPARGWSRPLSAADEPQFGPYDGTVPDPGSAFVEEAIESNICTPGFRNAADFIARRLGVAICDDQPQPRRVPDCRGGTYTDCRNELEDAGLEVRRTTRPIEAVPDGDIDLGDGAVVSTKPENGEHALPGDEVEAITNPERPSVPPAVDDENDRDCDFGPRGAYDPGWDLPSAAFTPAPTFAGIPSLGIDPDVDGGAKPVILRYGTLEWGRLHIANEHGWNADTERDTRLTISFGHRLSVNDRADMFDGSRRREYRIALPQRNIGGKLCGRLVIAELAYRPGDDSRYPNDANGREKGVVTSFGVRIR